MDISIVLVDEVNALVTTQIVECLLQREAEAATELGHKDECPLQFVLDVVFHESTMFPSAKVRTFSELAKK